MQQVKDVRVIGAVGVVEVNYDMQKMLLLRQEFIKKLIWLRPLTDVIYIMPPLVIEENDLIKITDAVFDILIKANT